MIFVDLDDFLIGWNSPTEKDTQTIVFPDKSAYSFAIRPTGKRFLETLSGLAPVKLMTSGTKEYAKLINQHCQFLSPEDIIAREDFLQLNPQTDQWEATTTGLCPKGILIDHQKLPEAITEAKLKALGITAARYIQAPYYCPWHDDILSQNIIEILCHRVKTLLPS